MKAKAVERLHNATVYLVLFFVGTVVVYLGAWLFETPIGFKPVERWSEARCGWAVLGSLICLLMYHGAAGGKPNADD